MVSELWVPRLKPGLLGEKPLHYLSANLSPIKHLQMNTRSVYCSHDWPDGSNKDSYSNASSYKVDPVNHIVPNRPVQGKPGY